MSINLNDTQKIQVQTHVELIQKAYAKVQAQQYAASELEKDFQGFVNSIITETGGDPNQQYTYNLETGTLELDKASQLENNGTRGTGDSDKITVPENADVGTSFDV